ncbi:hypothetical protein LguiB_004897 [Lonicera macranthoides]
MPKANPQQSSVTHEQAPVGSKFAEYMTNQEFLASHTGNLMPSKNISSSTTYNSFAYDNDGITSDTEYPYMATEGTCKATTSVAAQINGYEQVRPYDEEALLMAVASRPVSVGVDPSLFQFYQGGIITD